MKSEFGIEIIRTASEVRISGRLDGHSASVARVVLQTAIDDGVGDLVVHVPDLEIWDASGLGVLVGAQRRARQAGRRIVLIGVSPRQQRLLRATRLHRMLGVQRGPEPDPQDPVTSARGATSLSS